MAHYRIGIDLGGTNIAAGIVDEDFRLIRRASIKTAIPRSAEEITDDIAALCRRLCEEEGIDFADIEKIGIGSPGIILNGVVKAAENLFFFNVPLAKMLEERTGKPVVLRNDGNAAALGELVAGSGKGCQSLVAFTLGTGVGGGIVIDGKVIEGFNGAAGETGHIIVKAGGRPCACGNKGCLEAYCSATAIKKATREAMEAHPESYLHTLAPTPDAVNGKTAFDGKRAGDPAATQVVDEFIEMLAVGVASLIQLLQPQVVCIGGGIAKEGEYLLEPLRERVRVLTYADTLEENPVIVGATLGNDAGIIGAAV
jgi:glucokinase